MIRGDYWNTPGWYLQTVRYVLGVIDLDPCSNASSLVKARRNVILPEDGLTIEWRGRVFVNPPYSDVMPWVRKLLASPKVTAAIFLTHGDISASWCQRVLRTADAVCLHDKRIRFLDARGSEAGARPKLANISAYWGAEAARFHAGYKALGACYGRAWES